MLQKTSTIPDLSVEDNRALGGYLMRGRTAVKQAVERVFEQHPRSPPDAASRPASFPAASAAYSKSRAH